MCVTQITIQPQINNSEPFDPAGFVPGSSSRDQTRPEDKFNLVNRCKSLSKVRVLLEKEEFISTGYEIDYII